MCIRDRRIVDGSIVIEDHTITNVQIVADIHGHLLGDVDVVNELLPIVFPSGIQNLGVFWMIGLDGVALAFDDSRDNSVACDDDCIVGVVHNVVYTMFGLFCQWLIFNKICQFQKVLPVIVVPHIKNLEEQEVCSLIRHSISLTL